MKVRELISRLVDLSPDADVFVHEYNDEAVGVCRSVFVLRKPATKNDRSKRNDGSGKFHAAELPVVRDNLWPGNAKPGQVVISSGEQDDY